MTLAHTQRSERGAILVQVVLASLVLFGFGAFVMDYGLFWVSRAEAQNAADAGAFAGAVARAYDDLADPPDPGGVVPQIASSVARQHRVWTLQPPPGAVGVTFNCPADVAGGRCVRVDVYRDTEHGDALPTVFGPVWGITSQNVKATATAQVKVGDSTTCLRPWAIPDQWAENRKPTPEFDRYVFGAPLNTLLVPPPLDQYDPPTAATTGTGRTTVEDPAITLTFAPLSFPVLTGALQPIQLPGGNPYANEIAACIGNLVTVGQEMPVDAAATLAETTAGATALIALDPAARWNAFSRRIDSSCAPGCASLSPRLVPIALYDTDRYAAMLAAGDWGGCGALGPCVRIANIVGFFIDQIVGPGVIAGYLTSYPGLSTTGNLPPPLLSDSSFLKAVTLVR